MLLNPSKRSGDRKVYMGPRLEADASVPRSSRFGTGRHVCARPRPWRIGFRSEPCAPFDPPSRPWFRSPSGGAMPVSETNSKVIYDGLKAAGVGLVSAIPETWLVHLIRMAEDDPDMI